MHYFGLSSLKVENKKIYLEIFPKLVALNHFSVQTEQLYRDCWLGLVAWR